MTEKEKIKYLEKQKKKKKFVKIKTSVYNLLFEVQEIYKKKTSKISSKCRKKGIIFEMETK